MNEAKSIPVKKNRLLQIGIVGTILAALCCFTPVLVILFGALGLVAIVGYLDYILFPLLAVFILLIIVGWYRHRT